MQQDKPAQPPKKKALDGPTLLVFDLVNDAGVDKGVANTLAEMIIERITNLKKYNVVGQKDLDKMLFWEQNKQLKGCTDTACLVQIAGAMGAQYYVEGSIGVLADRYVVTLKLIEASNVRVLERVTQKVKKDDATLSRTIEPAVDVIMGLKTKEEFAAMHEEKPAATPAPLGVAKTVEPSEKFDKRFWGMTGTFTGIGVMAVGGVFAALSKKTADDYAAAGSQAELDDLAAKNGTYNTLAITGVVAGGLLAATGGVLWYLGADEKPATAINVTPMLTPNAATLQVGGSW
ncbi:MAG: hypothetical protein HY897_03150 [Deltaproteobacteria bacterium]|nr:hypothetical protein [Deltaproteobacteria bacterium]